MCITAVHLQIRFADGGERAVTNFESGKAGLEARGFRGLATFTSMPFEVSDDTDSVQMLQRSTQIGEFYRMAPPPVFDESKKLPGSYMGESRQFTNFSLLSLFFLMFQPFSHVFPHPFLFLFSLFVEDIMIYDEEADKLVHIEFEQALRACCVDNKADLMMLITGKKGVDPTNAAAFVKGDPQFDALQKIADDAVKHAAAAKLPALNLLKAPADFTLANLIQTVKNGICVKLCITIARPFIEHHMLSAVAAVSGRDTGATLYGPADMRKQNNRHRMSSRLLCACLKADVNLFSYPTCARRDLRQHVGQDDRGCVQCQPNPTQPNSKSKR